MKQLTPLLILWAVMTAVAALFTLFTPAVQADEVGGIIDTDTTWTLTGSPYIITDTVIITAGVTLTVAAGVAVQAQPGTGVVVNGSLLALGTPTQPITFTSTGETGPGDWDGIIIGFGSVTANHMTVRYGTVGFDLSGASTAPVELNNSVISQNQLPINVTPDALHRLQMSSVNVSGNISNRIAIPLQGDYGILSEDTALSDQPGLEGYEIVNSSFGSFVVPDGITLTLEPGVTLMSPLDNVIAIRGRLDAQGTMTRPITFTSAANSGPGEWGALIIGGETGTAVLEHVVVQYGHYGIGTRGDGLVTIENSLLQNNLNYPIYTNLVALPRLILTNTTFMNNGINRVVIDTEFPQSTLPASARLAPQPGLEGYEFDNFQPGSFIVPEGVTLSISAGATLFFAEDVWLQVRGELRAAGTAVAPITFTSAFDTGPGEWLGIGVDGGEVFLDHTTVRYGIINLTVNAISSSVILTGSRIISASVDGIVVQNGTVQATCSLIGGNGNDGVSVADTGNPAVTLWHNEIQGNANAGISNIHTLPVEARHNYWGQPSGPGGDGPGSGDAVYGDVLYDPWLAEPACLTPPPAWQIYLPAMLKP